ncbi:MAG: FAD-dependent oxidoreductase [Hyphomicrobiaceae bacterium]
MVQNEDGTYDVIVVGGGGSGLAAAAEAASYGARVLLIEKGAELGGTTAWSVGAYTTSSTPHQKRAGVVDSPEQHYADMDAVNANAKRPDNLGLRRILCFEGPDTLRWLMDMGVEFVGPNPEPPHTRPRMHNVVPSAKAYIYAVGKRCRELGVEIKCSCALADLVQEGGRIIGVEAEHGDGRRSVYRANTAVILASGDFSASKPMRARYFAQEVVNAEPMNPLATGEVLELGEKLGGRIVNGEYFAFYMPRMRFIPPKEQNWVMRLPPWPIVGKAVRWGLGSLPQALIRPLLMKFITTSLGPEPSLFRNGAALINPSGALIEVDFSSPAKHLALDPSNKGYILFDAKIAQRYEKWPDFVSTAPNVAYAYLNDYRKSRKDIYYEAPTLAELASRLGMSADTLAASIEAHNQAQTETGKRLTEPPFHALGPARGYLTQTEGGLAVSDRLEVLGADNAPIPGLFAAGCAGQGGVLLDGHGHHIAWAFVSGRYAARSALGKIRGNSAAGAPPNDVAQV